MKCVKNALQKPLISINVSKNVTKITHYQYVHRMYAVDFIALDDALESNDYDASIKLQSSIR